MKKLLSIIIIMLLVSTVYAADNSGSCGKNALWSIDQTGTVLTISGSGDMDNYSAEMNITPWKSHASDIQKIVISDGITSIGNCSFVWFTKLNEVEIGKDVSKIGEYAFGWCNAINKVSMPDSVQSVEEYAFTWCSALKQLDLNNVTEVDGSAISWCKALDTITLNSSNAAYTVDNGVLMNSDKTELVLYPIGLNQKDYTVPDTVTSVDEYAFFYTTLENVTLKNVSEIHKNAFFGSDKLKSIDFGKALTSIEDSAFYGCTALTEIALPEGLTSISEAAFKKCDNLTSVRLPKTLSDIGSEALPANQGITYYCIANTSAEKYLKNNGCTYYPTADVSLDGNVIKFDQRPVIIDGRTLVPVRAICEALGMKVEWNDSERKAVITKDSNNVIIKADDVKYTKNGVDVSIDVPAQIIGGRTLLPVRAISEAFGVKVGWDEENNMVILTK